MFGITNTRLVSKILIYVVVLIGVANKIFHHHHQILQNQWSQITTNSLKISLSLVNVTFPIAVISANYVRSLWLLAGINLNGNCLANKRELNSQPRFFCIQFDRKHQLHIQKCLSLKRFGNKCQYRHSLSYFILI